MSEALIASVPPKAALWVLSEIDNQCDIAAGCDVQIVRGPFGAFSHRQERATTTAPDDTSIEVGDVTVTEDSYNSLDDPFSDGSDETSPPVDLVRQDHGGYSLERSLSPWTQSLVQQILEQSEQISIPPSPDLRNMSFDSGRIQEILPGGINMQDFAMPPAMQGFQFAPLNTPYPFNQSLSTPAANGMTRAAGVVPQDAVLLLNHYATVVVNSLTPFRHSKTPWHVLFLPHAKNCLAALTLGETMDHASMSAFYGTLSISAYSLGGVSDAQMWLEAGKAYKNQAREQTKLMLRTAYDVPKTSKYKTILMALITMVQVSLFSGSRDQTECYLLETEKFIRLRGLNRKKSRKVRLLHHCYAFERIFHESMFICGANSKQRRHVRDAIQSSGLVVYGQDVPVFRINGWTNLFREMMAVKSQEDGENDLHIERPGLFVTTLYPEIYGVPEPWMFLLSQVIRLGNEKESSEQDDAAKPLNLKEFAARAKAIERCINQLQHPTPITDPSENPQRQIDRHVHENMLKGMQHALSIYFYRRIYDVDSSILQSKVLSVRDCLFRCQAADPEFVYGSSGFLWPAFIAACEAEDAEVQVSFANWFRNCAQRSGLSSFTNTLESVNRIWQERRSGNGPSITWLDLMRRDDLLRQQT